MIYMVSYDIASPDNNRKEVEKSIESLGKWCHILTTTYLVSTQHSLQSVQENIAKNLSSKDRMFVCEVRSYDGWFPKEDWDIINKMLR